MNICLLKYILLNEFIDIWLALPQFNQDSKSMEDKHLTIPFGAFAVKNYQLFLIGTNITINKPEIMAPCRDTMCLKFSKKS